MAVSLRRGSKRRSRLVIDVEKRWRKPFVAGGARYRVPIARRTHTKKAANGPRGLGDADFHCFHRDAAATGQAEAKTQAQAEWEGAWMQRTRAQEVLTALANSPVRPNGERLQQAAQLVLAGATWSEAANGAGWATSRSLKAAIKRILRATQIQR